MWQVCDMIVATKGQKYLSEGSVYQKKKKKQMDGSVRINVGTNTVYLFGTCSRDRIVVQEHAGGS